MRCHSKSAIAGHLKLLPKHCCAAHMLLQLAERREGHQAVRQQDLQKALHHFTRALSIVEFVRGSSPQEQQEVDSNAAAVLLEMAAVQSVMQVRSYCGYSYPFVIDGKMIIYFAMSCPLLCHLHRLFHC